MTTRTQVWTFRALADIQYFQYFMERKKKLTCRKSQNDGHPANNVRPGKAPVQEAFSEKSDGHSGVDCQCQKSEKAWTDKCIISDEEE